MSKLLIYKVTPNRTSEHLTLGEYAAAGFLSAIPTTLVTAPVERAKVLLQVHLTAMTGCVSMSSDHLCRFKARVKEGPNTRAFLTLLNTFTGKVDFAACFEVRSQQWRGMDLEAQRELLRVVFIVHYSDRYVPVTSQPTRSPRSS